MGPVSCITVDLSGAFGATCQVPYLGLVRRIIVDLSGDFWATSHVRYMGPVRCITVDLAEALVRPVWCLTWDL
jgi:hypothetical protein